MPQKTTVKVALTQEELRLLIRLTDTGLGADASLGSEALDYDLKDGELLLDKLRAALKP